MRTENPLRKSLAHVEFDGCNMSLKSWDWAMFNTSL